MDCLASKLGDDEGMKYSLEIEIEKPLDVVSDLFGDVNNLAFWQPGFMGIEEADGETTMSYQHGKRVIKMIEKINVNKLPGEFTASYTVTGMVMTVQNLFEEIGEGRTKWTSNNECKPSGFMKIMMWIMPGCAKKQSFSYMENFKAFAEEGRDIRTEKK